MLMTYETAARMFTLRDYQQYAVDSIYRYFESGKTGNPVIAMPTGTGKSLVIGGFIHELFQRWPTQRVMMLTHVKELIEQNASKLESMWPSAPLGIFSAGLKKKQAGRPITYAGIQSCAKAAALFGHIDLIIIDECHLVSPNQNTSYQKFIADLKVINPNIKVIGLSATPYRLGLGLITEGGIFTDICCDMTTMEGFNWFVDEGYLAPLIPFPTDTVIDLDDVKKRGGEFVDKDLQSAVNKIEITEAALKEAIYTAQDRERILVFATGVDHVNDIVAMLEMLGETAAGVHSKMPDKRDPVTKLTPREKALHDHKTGAVRWLVNNNVLTTGYDDPAIDCIIMLRPTMSPGLWVQMLGRGTRPLYWEGFDLSTAYGRLAAIAASPKQNCLVLDFAGNTARLGPVNDPVIPKKKGKGGGEPPVKFCEKDKIVKGHDPCGAFNHTSARFCCNCNAEFVFKPKITQQASSAELIKRKKTEPAPVKVETLPVDKVIYTLHTKANSANSMKVTYHCGMLRYNEWVPAWHDSNIKHKGKAWWRERTDLELPSTAGEAVAISDQLAVPSHIRVWMNKKYPEVMGCLFDETMVEEDA